MSKRCTCSLTKAEKVNTQKNSTFIVGCWVLEEEKKSFTGCCAHFSFIISCSEDVRIDTSHTSLPLLKDMTPRDGYEIGLVEFIYNETG